MGYYPIKNARYNPKRVSFTQKTRNGMTHIDFIKQDDELADNAWSTFILDEGNGFTKAGVERLNDSIHTYTWALIGSQAQTKSQIIGEGTAFDAQKQFLVNVETAIASPVDLPSAITRYQDVLQYAGSKVDFVFGIGLYMAPSDMNLQIGHSVGYNNNIMIASSNQTIGINPSINKINKSSIALNKNVNALNTPDNLATQSDKFSMTLNENYAALNKKILFEKIIVTSVALGLSYYFI